MKNLILLLSFFTASHLFSQLRPEVAFVAGPHHSIFTTEGSDEGFSSQPSLGDWYVGGRLALAVSEPWSVQLSVYSYRMGLRYRVEDLPDKVVVWDPSVVQVGLGLRRNFPLGSSRFRFFLAGELGFAEARVDSLPGLLYHEQGGDDYDFRVFREFRPRRTVNASLRGSLGLRYDLPLGFGLQFEMYYQQGFAVATEFQYMLHTENSNERRGTFQSRVSLIGVQSAISWTFPERKKKNEE